MLTVAGAVIAATAFLASLLLVRDTAAHVALEQAQDHLGADLTPPSLRSAFARATYHEPALRSCSQAGLVNNLNDGLAWGLLPLFLAAHGTPVGQIGLVAALYPAVWSLAQIPVGHWSDTAGRKPLIVGGMLVQPPRSLQQPSTASWPTRGRDEVAERDRTVRRAIRSKPIPDTSGARMTPSNTQTYLAKGTTASGFRADRTVVLIIDPVNDFLSEGGAAWDLTKSTVKKNDVVGSLRRVIDGAHERAVPVLFAPMAYTEEDYADEQLQRRTAINRIMFERRMFLAGSWGADFHPDLQPSDADIVLEPHKGTDVAETDLLEHLERLGTTHVVICGMTANLCCESTGRHLAEHGFDVTYLSDAIGAESLPAYEASIHLNYPLIGNAVLEVDELLVALDEGAQQQAPQAGDTVYGSDRGKIGTIDEIVPASADNAGHLLVKRGVILDRDIYIPIDAVTRRAGESVVINVPKLVVGKMPWDEPPSPADVTAKQGPAAAQVEHLYGSRSPSGAPAA